MYCGQNNFAWTSVLITWHLTADSYVPCFAALCGHQRVPNFLL